MTKFRDIHRRIDRIGGGGGGDDRPVPTVLRVAFGETKAAAFARFNAEYPNRKPGHNVLVVPAKPSTPEEFAIYEARFFESQNRLVAEARSNRLAVVTKQPAPHAPPRRWPTSPTIRPNGPHLTWKPNG